MARTRSRPLPMGGVSPAQGRLFATILSLAGLTLLAVGVNLVATAVTLVTLVSYAWVYTPMKRRTGWAVFVGAVPGALPPVIGWAAAQGELTVAAWLLFGIVFAWQLPHFHSLAWLYRDDYARAGFQGPGSRRPGRTPHRGALPPLGRRTGRRMPACGSRGSHFGGLRSYSRRLQRRLRRTRCPLRQPAQRRTRTHALSRLPDRAAIDLGCPGRGPRCPLRPDLLHPPDAAVDVCPEPAAKRPDADQRVSAPRDTPRCGGVLYMQAT